MAGPGAALLRVQGISGFCLGLLWLTATEQMFAFVATPGAARPFNGYAIDIAQLMSLVRTWGIRGLRLT